MPVAATKTRAGGFRRSPRPPLPLTQKIQRERGKSATGDGSGGRGRSCSDSPRRSAVAERCPCIRRCDGGWPAAPADDGRERAIRASPSCCRGRGARRSGSGAAKRVSTRPGSSPGRVAPPAPETGRRGRRSSRTAGQGIRETAGAVAFLVSAVAQPAPPRRRRSAGACRSTTALTRAASAALTPLSSTSLN